MSLTQPVQVIAITGGKGGVGKTTIAINLALTMVHLGRRVALFDAAFGLGNVHVYLGIQQKHELNDFIQGHCEFKDIVHTLSSGLQVIPTANYALAKDWDARVLAGLIQAFDAISHTIDVLIIDTGNGIGRNVLSVVASSQEILIVLEDNAASLHDACALIRRLCIEEKVGRFRILINKTGTMQEGKELFLKLQRELDELDVVITFAGNVPLDENASKAQAKYKSLIEAFPRSKASLAFKSLAQKMDAWPLPANPKGRLEFFVQNLLERCEANASRS